MSEAAAELQSLVELARDRAQSSRRVLVQNIADMFLTSEGRLSDRERALMSDILGKLISEMETGIRRRLAEKFARLPDAPRDLIVLLANDELPVARPVLLHSPVLQDKDLIEIVKLRTHEHRLALAMRQPLSEFVADALIDYGEEDVIQNLIDNPEATLSRRAMDYLVEESRRQDRFQEPLLLRRDLPPELAHRMFWWVSASLRGYILSQFKVDPGLVDQLLQETTGLAVQAPHAAMSEAEELALGLHEQHQINERFLVQTLRGGRVSLFIACIARTINVDMLTARRITFDVTGDPLAVAWRACGFNRASFATIFMLTRQAHEKVKAMDPKQLTKILALFDSISVERAKIAIRYWMRDNNYLTAIRQLEQDA